MSSLSENENQNVQCHPVNNTYRFIDILITSENKSVMSNTDVVANYSFLLLSRNSMQKAYMTLDLKNDNAMIFCSSLQLIFTLSNPH